MSVPSNRRAGAALLAFSLIGLADCHKPEPAESDVKLDGPALATLLFTGDGWGEYAPCG
jgi:hypothetical protein